MTRFIAITTFLAVVISTTANGQNCSGQLTASNGSYTVNYTVNGTSVNFNVSANIEYTNTGIWIALGFTTKNVQPFMYPADIVLAGTFVNGSSFIDDRFINEISVPLNDTVNNLNNTNVNFTNGQLTMQFSRQLVSTDSSGQDVNIDTSRVWIWAIGNISNDVFYNGKNGTLNDGNPVQLPTSCIQCSNGSVILVHSSVTGVGPFELCINKTYTPLCPIGWNKSNAAVVCRQLNFTNNWADVFLTTNTTNSALLQRSYTCTGYESSLSECPERELDTCEDTGIVSGVICGSRRPEVCSHNRCSYDTVVINCYPFDFFCDGYPDCPTTLNDEYPESCPGLCTKNDTRLIGGENRFVGRIEICSDFGWYGAVCSNSVDSPEAAVACRELFGSNMTGYPVNPRISSAQFRGDTVFQLKCQGNESALSQCNVTRTYSCNSQLAVIQCISSVNCTDGELRLVGGKTEREGIVEICRNGVFGYICSTNTNWKFANASNICTQLEYVNEGSIAVSFYESIKLFGYPETQVIFDYSQCSSTYSTPAAVICRNSTEYSNMGCNYGDNRFTHSDNTTSGIVQVCYNNTWYSLCYHMEAALQSIAPIICNKLGFNYSSIYSGGVNEVLFPSDPVIEASFTNCSGNEDTILNCSDHVSIISTCTGNMYALVACSTTYSVVVYPIPDGETNIISLDEGRSAYVRCLSLSEVVNFRVTKDNKDIFYDNASPVVTVIRTIVTNLSDAGTYQCTATGTSDEATLLIPFTLSFNVSVKPAFNPINTTVFFRVSVFVNQVLKALNLDIDFVDDNPERIIPYLEDYMLSIFPVSLDGVQTISCQVVARRPIDYEHSYNRFQCQLTTVPMQSDFIDVVKDRVSQVHSLVDNFIALKTLRFSRFGFCDFERSISNDYYSWPEIEIGTTTTQLCNFGPNGMASRTCESSSRSVINLDNCTSPSIDNCKHGEVRLIGRNSSASGLLQVCYNGIFGSVCNSSKVQNSSSFLVSTYSTVACRQLGMSIMTDIAPTVSTRAVTALDVTNVGGPITLDGLFCQGSEYSLTDCQYNPFGVHDCNHDEDVVLFCEEFNPCNTDQHYCSFAENKCLSNEFVCDGCIDCIDFSDETYCPIKYIPCMNEGEVRFLDSQGQIASDYSGVLNVCYNGSWTLVCDYLFGNLDATVACRQAGLFNRSGVIESNSIIPAQFSNYPLAFGGLLCNGTEANLNQCSISGDVVAICDKDKGNFGPDSSTVIMSCILSDTCTDEGDIRLVGGTIPNEGIVELCAGGHYGHICQDSSSSGNSIGQVTCRQLGFDPSGALPFAGTSGAILFGQATSPPLSRIQTCNISSSLLECVQQESNTCDEQFLQVAFGVRCDDIKPNGCTNGDVRLVSRTSAGSGIVQICVNGTWSSLCSMSSSLDMNEAVVMCRQLGFQTNGANFNIITPNILSNGTNNFTVNLQCTGNETNVTNCFMSGPVLVSNCAQGYVQLVCPETPLVGLFPLPPTNSSNYNFEQNRVERVQCVFAAPSADLSGSITITKINSTGSFTTVTNSNSADLYAQIQGGLLNVNEGVSSNDDGRYICNATSQFGLNCSVETNITVTLATGTSFSITTIRASIQNLNRLQRLLPRVQVPSVQSVLDSARLSFLRRIPVNEPGVQSVQCTEVSNRPEDTARAFVRFECQLINFPAVDNTRELAEKYIVGTNANVYFICPNSYNYSDTGFCDYEVTMSNDGFQYRWPETTGGTQVTLTCQGDAEGTANRLCSINGDWEEPDIEDCNTNKRYLLLRTTLMIIRILTYVAIILSLICLAVTVITLLLFKKLRKKDASKFHVQLSLSLFAMLLVFVVGIDKVEPVGGCITVGVLIHYFALVTWMWMGAEAVLVIQKIITELSKIKWYYILIVSIICWAIPLIPVIVPLAINSKFYFSNVSEVVVVNTTTNITIDVIPGYCFISNQHVFIGSFLAPISAIIAFCCIAYLVMFCAIAWSKPFSSSKFIQNVVSLMVILLLFGLGWLFGILAFSIVSNVVAHFVFHLLFIVFAALLGLFILVYFVLLGNDAREAWASLVKHKSFEPQIGKFYVLERPVETPPREMTELVVNPQPSQDITYIENTEFDFDFNGDDKQTLF